MQKIKIRSSLICLPTQAVGMRMDEKIRTGCVGLCVVFDFKNSHLVEEMHVEYRVP